ncbi:NAD(P)H-dependent oxidoreductase [Robiginitalea sp. IMCC44478]|uniref:NAD(P)H-dependent oxidoreductase n=1 Tax=Robiginitalea sp. IMCC44478 TaxID=3459122 RepID=UPI0040417208
MQNTLDSLYWRYAVKKFDSSKILEEEKLDKLKTAFNLTATSYGLQPLKLLVVRHRELQQELVRHSYGQRQVADASHLLILCIEQTIDQKYIESYFNKVQAVRGTPGEVLDPFKKSLIESFSSKTDSEIQTWATHQAYLALGNLLTVCAVEQIDSCPMEGFDPTAYNKVLNLEPRGLHAVLVLPVGYRAPDDMFASFKKVRRDLEKSVLTIGPDTLP